MGIYCSGAGLTLAKALPGFRGAAAGSPNVVEGDGAGTEKDEGKGKSGQSEREFVPAVTGQSVVEVHFGNGDGEIDADGEGGDAREEAEQNEQSAEELSESGEISRPAWESEAGDEVSVVVKSAENLVVTVNEHDGTQGETHDKECERLQAIEVAHRGSSEEKQITAARRSREAWASHFSGRDCSKAKDCARGQLLVTFFRRRIRVAGGA
jgi:hypothetical protein